MTKVLLTGATGFVGRQVMRELVKQGTAVSLILREGSKVPHGCDNVIWTPDLFAENQAFWDLACQGIDTVIHAAWYAEPGLYQTSSKNLDCLVGTIKLARGAVTSGVRRFLGIGTCFEYDLTSSALLQKVPLSSSDNVSPSTPYGAAKAAAWTCLSQVLPLEGVSFSWCRLFYIYGEGENARRLVPYIRSQLKQGLPAELTSGRQVLDFLNVKEAGRQIVNVALGNQTGALNVCSGIPVSVAEIASSIAKSYGRPELIKLGSRSDGMYDPPFVVGVPDIVMTKEDKYVNKNFAFD